jgi:hypothetical protein
MVSSSLACNLDLGVSKNEVLAKIKKHKKPNKADDNKNNNAIPNFFLFLGIILLNANFSES